jgi:hypothetical protein
VAVACLAISIYATPSISEADRTALMTQSLVITPISGALYAAAAAWYKRFLNLANPNRAARAQQQRGRGSRPVRSRTSPRRR